MLPSGCPVLSELLQHVPGGTEPLAIMASRRLAKLSYAPAGAPVTQPLLTHAFPSSFPSCYRPRKPAAGKTHWEREKLPVLPSKKTFPNRFQIILSRKGRRQAEGNQRERQSRGVGSHFSIQREQALKWSPTHAERPREWTGPPFYNRRCPSRKTRSTLQTSSQQVESAMMIPLLSDPALEISSSATLAIKGI